MATHNQRWLAKLKSKTEISGHWPLFNCSDTKGKDSCVLSLDPPHLALLFLFLATHLSGQNGRPAAGVYLFPPGSHPAFLPFSRTDGRRLGPSPLSLPPMPTIAVPEEAKLWGRALVMAFILIQVWITLLVLITKLVSYYEWDNELPFC